MRVLGIDPAWTSKNPSGIALIEKDSEDHWKCIRLAPSIQLFMGSDQEKNMFQGKISGGFFDLQQILQKVGKVDCIVVDMPLSIGHCLGRRLADNLISKQYGAYLCATHSPTKEILEMGKRILEQAENLKYVFNENIIETYPHPAIIELIRRTQQIKLAKRLAYKVGKRNSYWKELSLVQRKEKLVSNMLLLRESIAKKISISDSFIFNETDSYAMLKSYEDTLDALVCAWVGTEFLQKKCKPYGDDNSKIWLPINDAKE